MSFKMKGIRFDTGEKFAIDRSNIDGLGVIASKNIKKGEFIGTAVTNESSMLGEKGIYCDTRTILGQKMNHQDNENTMQRSENNALNIYAKNNIRENEEITVNYINLPDYVDKSQVTGYKK